VLGSRTCFVFCSCLFFATSLWAAGATSLNSLIGARVLGGIAGAITEAFAAAIVSDLFFLHERGWWMGVYMFCQNTGGNIGGVITGFLISVGWRWHFWVFYLHFLMLIIARGYCKWNLCGFHLPVLPRDTFPSTKRCRRRANNHGHNLDRREKSV
jgi:MFS family permease